MKTKRNKTIRTRKKRKTTRKYKNKGGKRDAKLEREYITKENFRNMFINAFKKMHPTASLPDAHSFANSLRRHQSGINTLIAVTTNYMPISKHAYSESKTPLIAFVPMLSILLFHIRDPALQKMFIQSFIQNKGNINLKSMTKNITALSTSIEVNDAKLAKYLVQQGADKNNLTPEQQNQLSILVTGLPSTESVQKLIIAEEVPEHGYNLDTEPDFWKPVFAPNEMLTLRQAIHAMMASDTNIGTTPDGKMAQMWSVCQIVKTIIPSYYVPTSNEPYTSFGSLVYDQMVDFSHYNILLCTALLVYGIISYKMNGQDYELLFKGGKATQLVLAGIEDINEYKTEDIDVLVMQKPNIPYDPTTIQKLSGHIAHLVKWFLNQGASLPESQGPFRISVLAPNPENKRANPHIYKLSYIKHVQKRDYKRQIMVDDYKPFSDIDFKETPSSLKPFFDKAVDYIFSIDELQTKVSFRCPNLGALLDEKLYYYAKYKKIIQDNKPIPEEGLTIEECYRLLEKFKRSIVAMNRGLQKQRFGSITEDELKEKEKITIQSRLEKLDVNEESLVNGIIQDLTM